MSEDDSYGGVGPGGTLSLGSGDRRSERIGSALAQMARDLVAARREIGALRRENAMLRARLEAGASDSSEIAGHRNGRG